MCSKCCQLIKLIEDLTGLKEIDVKKMIGKKIKIDK